MNVVVTGGAGFIGSRLVRKLEGLETVGAITVLDDLSGGRLDNLAGRDVRLIRASILDRDALRSAFRGADVVVHLAARPSVPRSIAEPEPCHDVNTSGTFNVLEAARGEGVGHFIYASSSSVYGANPILPKAEHLETIPVSPYAAAKLAGEHYALVWQRTYGLPTLAFRFFNVFGPNQRADHPYAAVVPRFIRAALLDEPLVVFGDGTQTRDFTYVEDVCAAIVRCIKERTCSPSPVNLAFGGRTSIQALVRLVSTAVGRTIEIHYEPERPGDVRDSQADPAVLESLLPALPQTPLEDAIQETASWMRSELNRI